MESSLTISIFQDFQSWEQLILHHQPPLAGQIHSSPKQGEPEVALESLELLAAEQVHAPSLADNLSTH